MKFKLRLDPRQVMEMSLHLRLTPKMIMELKTLQVPYIDLAQRIDEEAAQNVVLEVQKGDELYDYIKTAREFTGLAGAKEFREFPLAESPAPELREVLMSQLRLLNLTDKDYGVGEYLVGVIDEKGYLKDYEQIKAEIVKKFGVLPGQVDDMLNVIQTFEPEGIGARDLKECLKIQIREYNFENEELESLMMEIAESHLENLAGKKYEEIASALGIEKRGVEGIADFIANNLNPNPGLKYSSAKDVRYILPSLEVTKTDNGFQLTNLERKKGPQLTVNQKYIDMLEDANTDEETKKYIKERVKLAYELIGTIEKRYNTLERVAEQIMKEQQQFFESGPNWLKPLLQKDLAAMVGVHPSTVSRALSGKYIQTSSGILPIKYLCREGYLKIHTKKIKDMLKDLVENESKAKPYSDEEIESLYRNHEIKIARRTINKYRQELKIPSSYERRQGKGIIQ